MPRYYFDLHSEPDEIGLEFPDADTARREALAAAKAMFAEQDAPELTFVVRGPERNQVCQIIVRVIEEEPASED